MPASPSMYVIADVHEAVLTNPESSVTWPVSLSRALISTPDGPSVASRMGRSSFPLGYERLNSLIGTSLHFPVGLVARRMPRGHAPAARGACPTLTSPLRHT